MPLTPMRLLRLPEPFDHPAFVFEPKIDGFRALAYIERGRCTLVSRNGHVFRSWPALGEAIAQAVECGSAMLDGEICCVGADGRSDFYRLMFRRAAPVFYAFDLLQRRGRDLCRLPLLERKAHLRAIVPTDLSRLLYLDHLHERGRDLFRVSCERDLEGVVGKWKDGSYRTDGKGTSWVKIKNPDYSQMAGRRELFEMKRRPLKMASASLELQLR